MLKKSLTYSSYIYSTFYEIDNHVSRHSLQGNRITAHKIIGNTTQCYRNFRSISHIKHEQCNTRETENDTHSMIRQHYILQQTHF